MKRTIVNIILWVLCLQSGPAHGIFYYDDNLTVDQLWESQYRLPLIYERYFYPQTVSTYAAVRELYANGVRYYLRNQNYTSIGYINRALAKETDNHILYAFRGRNWQALGFPRKALEDYRRAFTLNPKFPEALSYISNYNYTVRNFPRAVFFFKKHVAGEHPLIQEELVNCMTSAGWVGDKELFETCRAALKAYQETSLDAELAQLNPRRPYPLNIATLKTKAELQSALDKYWRDITFLKQNRISYDSYSTNADYLKTEYDGLRSTINLLTKMEYRFPGELDIYRYKHAVFTRYKKDRLLEQNYIRWIGMMPGEPAGYFGLAELYVRQNKKHRALGIYRKWFRRLVATRYPLEWDENDTRILGRLSKLYAQLGRPKMSRVNYELAQIFRASVGNDRKNRVLAVYRVKARVLELADILYAVAQKEGNAYMAERLEESRRSIQVELEIFER